VSVAPRRGSSGVAAVAGPVDPSTGIEPKDRARPAERSRLVLPSASRTPTRWSTPKPWSAEVEAFVKTWERERSIGDRWAKGLRYTLARIPALLLAAGVEPRISGSKGVTSEHVDALRTRTGWGRATTQFYFAALRQFLRWTGNPVADSASLWRLAPSTAQRRRWITADQLVKLLRAARGRTRLMIALEGFNGLRRVEVLRLRASDINLAEGWLNVRGKGRMGGKWRQIPLSDLARKALAPYIEGLAPLDRILPYSASWADQRLSEAAAAAGFARAGVRVSHHDLRRTFGRVAHSAGMDLVQLKNLYGHASLEMSVHYIGLDLERMREGLTQVDRALAPLLREGGRRGKPS
jgi:integrase